MSLSVPSLNSCPLPLSRSRHSLNNTVSYPSSKLTFGKGKPSFRLYHLLLIAGLAGGVHEFQALRPFHVFQEPIEQGATRQETKINRHFYNKLDALLKDRKEINKIPLYEPGNLSVRGKREPILSCETLTIKPLQGQEGKLEALDVHFMNGQGQVDNLTINFDIDESEVALSTPQYEDASSWLEAIFVSIAKNQGWNYQPREGEGITHKVYAPSGGVVPRLKSFNPLPTDGERCRLDTQV